VLNDWQKECQFKALNKKKDEYGVKDIHNGVKRLIDIKVSLFVFSVDKSALTGESDRTT